MIREKRMERDGHHDNNNTVSPLSLSSLFCLSERERERDKDSVSFPFRFNHTHTDKHTHRERQRYGCAMIEIERVERHIPSLL
jgi:hypothetical protein